MTPRREEETAARAERARRAAFFAEARRLTPYVAATMGDELFFVATDDKGVGQGVFVTGRGKEVPLLKRAVATLEDSGVRRPPQPVLVDVGANIGTTTVLALRRHGFSSGVALEPSPVTFRTLRLNLLANGLEERVRALPFAASDREGHVPFEVSHSSSGRHRIQQAAPPRSGDPVLVEAVTLDGLVARGVIDPESVGLLWIDAQGHEGEVLEGAAGLTEVGAPVVVAIRQGAGRPTPLGAEPQARASLLERLAGDYTDVFELRAKTAHGRRYPIRELAHLVESVEDTQDLLLIRR